MAPVADAVTVSLEDLKNGTVSFETLVKAFGPDGLGILIVKDLPEAFLPLRRQLLSYSSYLGNLPKSELVKLENEKAKYLTGWSLGKETLKNGQADTLKGSYYANCAFYVDSSLACSTPTPEFNEGTFPEYLSPNIWPDEATLPGFKVAFEDLCRMVIDTAVLVARACDRYATSEIEGYPGGYLERMVGTSTTTKARLLHYYPEEVGEEVTKVAGGMQPSVFVPGASPWKKDQPKFEEPEATGMNPSKPYPAPAFGAAHHDVDLSTGNTPNPFTSGSQAGQAPSKPAQSPFSDVPAFGTTPTAPPNSGPFVPNPNSPFATQPSNTPNVFRPNSSLPVQPPYYAPNNPEHYNPAGNIFAPKTQPACPPPDDDTWCATHLDHGCLTGLTSAMLVEESVPSTSALLTAPSFTSTNPPSLSPLDELDNPPDEVKAAGLYIRSRTGETVQVKIPRDCLAFQTGEALERITGGRFKAVPHFVKGPKAIAGGRRIARNTLAVFTQPELGEEVDREKNVTFGQFAREIVERNTKKDEPTFS